MPLELQNSITVDTVERYQGSERDIIIMSLSVNYLHDVEKIVSMSNIDGLDIDRKLNVALTRAKEHLICIGNASILSNNPVYENFIMYHKDKGTYYNWGR